MIKKEGYNIDKQHIDCGIEIYDKKTQDTHSGGSGCACSAVTFCGKIFHQLKSKNLNRILFIPTGALMSPTSLQQGENIAGIAHGVIIENWGDFMDYLKAFCVGGLICVIGQILIDKTNLHLQEYLYFL